MIKARAGNHDNTPLYFLGLSEDNLKRLRAGMPILIRLEELGGPPGSGDLCICWGQTDLAIVKQFLSLDQDTDIEFGRSPSVN